MNGYLSLIWKDSVTHIHGLRVCVKEGLPSARNLPPENSVDSYLCVWVALLPSVSCFFFLKRLPSLSLCSVFDAILSNINEVLSINQSAINVFVFGYFNIHHKDWLIGLVHSVIIFLSQVTLLKWLTFLLGSLTVTPTVLFFWIYFFDASICSTMAIPPWRNSDHVVVSVSIDFPSNSKRDFQFHCIAYDYSHANWDGLHDHLRDAAWEYIFKLCLCCC